MDRHPTDLARNQAVPNPTNPPRTFSEVIQLWRTMPPSDRMVHACLLNRRISLTASSTRASDLASELGVSTRAILLSLERLVSRGIVARTAPDRSRVQSYAIIERDHGRDSSMTSSSWKSFFHDGDRPHKDRARALTVGSSSREDLSSPLTRTRSRPPALHARARAWARTRAGGRVLLSIGKIFGSQWADSQYLLVCVWRLVRAIPDATEDELIRYARMRSARPGIMQARFPPGVALAGASFADWVKLRRARQLTAPEVPQSSTVAADVVSRAGQIAKLGRR